MRLEARAHQLKKTDRCPGKTKIAQEKAWGHGRSGDMGESIGTREKACRHGRSGNMGEGVVCAGQG